MENQSKQPKLVVEVVFERFKEFCKELYGTVGEPNSLLLVVDWRIGNTDYPAGVLIPRNTSVNPADLLEVASQLGKMSRRVLEIYEQAIEEAKLSNKRATNERDNTGTVDSTKD